VSQSRSQVLNPIAWLICGLCLWIAAVVGVRAHANAGIPVLEKSTVTAKSSTQAPKPAAAAQVPSSTAKLVGEATCLTCHEAQKAGYVNSPHHRAMDPRTPGAQQSCETCHGPGSEHAADPLHNKVKDFTKLPADQVNATCTTCHNRGEHALWDGSTHEARGLACTSCHSVHDAKSEKAQLKAKTQIELCGTCHRDKVLKLQKTAHMPVREGKLECTSCHNPHGSTSPKMLKVGDSVTELCTSCHAEKRGPFLWEHAPVREGCVTCHDPHGSSNERMLVAKLPMLCQRCHVSSRHPATIYDQTQLAGVSNRLLSRACVNCHAAIHGSNHPAGQFFLR
jgi:DmsE family decaheme c-type cytochrome